MGKTIHSRTHVLPCVARRALAAILATVNSGHLLFCQALSSEKPNDAQKACKEDIFKDRESSMRLVRKRLAPHAGWRGAEGI